MEEVIASLARRIKALEDTSVKYRRGTVSAAGPDIKLGGSDVAYEDVKLVMPGMKASDQVATLTFGHDILALGRIETSGVKTYTPTWTGASSNPAIVNGTITGRYQRFGDLVWVSIVVMAGSSTTFGSGAYNLTLPVAGASGFRQTLHGVLSDVGTQSYLVGATINGSSSFEEILAVSNSVGPTNWQPTSPFTFGNTDRITISGVYAVA